MDSNTNTQSPDPARKAPLPRAGTFRTSRPLSTNGPRRGATFLNRPPSFSASPDDPSAEQQHQQPHPPRLRRGSSFVSSAARTRKSLTSLEDPQTQSPHTLQLRRGAPNINSPDNTRSVPVSRPSSKRLPRAGTFAAFGTPTPSSASSYADEDSSQSTGQLPTQIGSADIQQSISDVDQSHQQRKDRSQRVCGMCSGCSVGIKAMPPWAPERLATMTPAERGAVFRDLQHKEERGHLEAELRKKRLSDMQAVATRLDERRAGGRQELESESVSEERVSDGKVFSEDYDEELESVDLGTENASVKSGDRPSRRRSRGVGTATASAGSSESIGVDDADISAAVQDGKGKSRRARLEEDCAQCGDLEGKVKDLEEQLGVLREVVGMCGQPSDKTVEEKKPKSWKDKVISAYFGASAVGNERSRLRAEVEALRKATDFLFHKLQPHETQNN